MKKNWYFILASAEYNADVFPQSLEVSFNSILIGWQDARWKGIWDTRWYI